MKAWIGAAVQIRVSEFAALRGERVRCSASSSREQLW